MFKKIIAYALIGISMVVVSYKAYAVDPVVSREEYVGYDVWKITATFSENGSGSLGNIDGWVFLATVNHNDGTPCADNMDITVTDDDGVDVMGGSLVDLTPSTADTYQAAPTLGSSYGARWVAGAATATFTETSTADCYGDLFIYFAR